MKLDVDLKDRKTGKGHVSETGYDGIYLTWLKKKRHMNTGREHWGGGGENKATEREIRTNYTNIHVWRKLPRNISIK